MRDMTMENNSSSSSEDSPEHSSTNETVQKMELGEKSCLESDERNPSVAENNQKASSSGLNRMDNPLNSFAGHLKGGAADDVSSENVRHSDQDSQLSTDEPEKNDGKKEQFERNLEKFLKERKPLREVQLRKRTEISARQVRSDGEMAKIIEYCGDVLKLSSTLSITERSSAPPTFSNETVAKQNTQTEENICVESSKTKITSKGVAKASDILKKDEVGTETSSPTRALDQRLSKISAFKVPISPGPKKTPSNSPKMGPSCSNEDVATPVQRRPTHFNVRPRKAYYTFSPGSSSGVLRQSQSLPDINRPQRKDETHRRSINFGEHSRVVRFLFKDKPEPATPENKMSYFCKSGIPLETPESTESSSEEEVPKTLQNIPSKICRKLVFASCSKETADKNQNAVINVSCIPKAQKCTSPDNAPEGEAPKTLQNRPSKSCRKLDFGSTSKETTDKSQQTSVSCDAESPSKRKNESPVEAGYSVSTKKVKTLSRTKAVESRNCKNVSPVDVECSISAKEVRTSSETRIEGSGSNENVRKNESPIDLECSISAKKLKTSSEVIVESESDESLRKN